MEDTGEAGNRPCCQDNGRVNLGRGRFGPPENVVSNDLSAPNSASPPASGVFERPATGLEDLDQPRFAQSTCSNGQNQVHEFFLVGSWLPIVHQQECDRRVCTDSLIAVEEGVVLAEMKKAGCCHSRNGSVQEFVAECRLGRGYGRFKSGSVAIPGDPPYRSICCSWISGTSSRDRNTDSMKCVPVTHSASFRNALPYRLCAHSWAASNFFRRADGLAGATISCLPSVLTSSGVSGSILRRSRIGRSITNARLFPCLVSFFLYQAASWKTARRVVTKVEFHFGELFPRVGFIVTNQETDSRAVVRFYNKRGAAEQ